MGGSNRRQQIKDWYDGFTFGEKKDIYKPWSIISFLDERKVGAYWANTSSNSLVGKLIREGSPEIKKSFEQLLCGGSIRAEIDGQIVYDQLEENEGAVWSLLLASGYLKVKDFQAYLSDFGEWKEEYELELTNFEVRVMFRNMVRGWFAAAAWKYNDFIKALLLGDLKAMNIYMNKVTIEMFSCFDTGKTPSQEEPERFYHGFVLGLMVELADKYVVTSNRESGFGRYDVVMEPRKQKDGGIVNDAVILEFKVQDGQEKELADTAAEALRRSRRRIMKHPLLQREFPESGYGSMGLLSAGKRC